MNHAEMQHRLPFTAVEGASSTHRIWQQKQFEPVRDGTIADTSSKPWDRLATENTHHHECAHAELKEVTEERQSMQLQVEKAGGGHGEE